MTDKTKVEPYKVLHRFRLPSGWVEKDGEPIKLTKRQAEGPLSQGLIEPAVVVEKKVKAAQAPRNEEAN